MEMKLLKAKVDRAIHRLFKCDEYILKIDINERTISHKLAIYLQFEFDDWDVDCEYNRNWNEKKQIQVAKQLSSIYPTVPPDDDHAISVYPDIIIHHRKTRDNLLAVEVKKTSNTIPSEYDLWKLSKYRHQLGYQHGLFLRVITSSETIGIGEMLWSEEISAEEYQRIQLVVKEMFQRRRQG